MVLSFAPLSSSSEVKYVKYSFRTWSVKEGGHPSNPYLLFHQKICCKRGKRKKQMPRILRFLHKFWTSKTTSVQFILQMSYVIDNLMIIFVGKPSINIITITITINIWQYARYLPHYNMHWCPCWSLLSQLPQVTLPSSSNFVLCNYLQYNCSNWPLSWSDLYFGSQQHYSSCNLAQYYQSHYLEKEISRETLKRGSKLFTEGNASSFSQWSHRINHKSSK